MTLSRILVLLFLSPIASVSHCVGLPSCRSPIVPVSHRAGLPMYRSPIVPVSILRVCSRIGLPLYQCPFYRDPMLAVSQSCPHANVSIHQKTSVSKWWPSSVQLPTSPCVKMFIGKCKHPVCTLICQCSALLVFDREHTLVPICPTSPIFIRQYVFSATVFVREWVQQCVQLQVSSSTEISTDVIGCSCLDQPLFMSIDRCLHCQWIDLFVSVPKYLGPCSQ